MLFNLKQTVLYFSPIAGEPCVRCRVSLQAGGAAWERWHVLLASGRGTQGLVGVQWWRFEQSLSLSLLNFFKP